VRGLRVPGVETVLSVPRRLDPLTPSLSPEAGERE
jgi:hypothetical protein